MPEALRVVGMSVLLVSPVGASIGLIVWATRGPRQGSWALLPLVAAITLTTLGLVLTVRAPDAWLDSARPSSAATCCLSAREPAATAQSTSWFTERGRTGDASRDPDVSPNERSPTGFRSHTM